jgi:hypothetical protein
MLTTAGLDLGGVVEVPVDVIVAQNAYPVL